VGLWVGGDSLQAARLRDHQIWPELTAVLCSAIFSGHSGCDEIFGRSGCLEKTSADPARPRERVGTVIAARRSRQKGRRQRWAEICDRAVRRNHV